jgi:hypothetical protein
MSSGIDPTLAPLPNVPSQDFSQIPSAPATPQRQGFVDTVTDAMSLNWFMQSADRLVEQLYPSQPGYDPMQEQRLKGRENWAPMLWDARSPEEFHARMDRFMENEDRRARGSVNDTIWSDLAAGIADPLNLVPVPAGMVGKGIAKGALMGAAVNAGLAVPSYLVRKGLDPTQPESIREELFYGAAFGAVLGGLGGFAVGDYHPTVGRIAREMSERQAYLDGELNPTLGGSGLEVPQRLTKYEPRGSTGTEGIKPALGTETLIGKAAWWNPFGTPWGELVQSGHRSLQDWAQLMGGDGGLTLKDAESGIAATGPSAWLAARGAGRRSRPTP